MEFPFSINNVLSQRITKIRHNLLPEGFSGDHRSAWDHASKISDILDEMGKASAVAQGLQKAITSGERLRNSEHTVYLLIDPEGKSQGSLVGLLKIGRKKLFMFDAAGAHHEMQPLCILDFYVHESKQRMGCGKALYEYMLWEEKTSPQYLAIDRPSEKFLGFLYKHYGLDKILPQTNNFVVFEGFFIGNPDQVNNGCNHLLQSRSSSHITTDPQSKPSSVRNIQAEAEERCCLQQSLYGRYAAHRPPSTIGKILQNNSSQQHEHNGGTSHFAFDMAYEPPFSPAGDCGVQETCKSPKSFVVELNAEVNSAPASCRLHHSTSPVKRDLKFSHSPLW